jgi:hypothetical protein
MNVRKNYLIHRRFQWDFVFKVSLAIFGPAFVCCLLLLIYLQFFGKSSANAPLAPFYLQIWWGFFLRLLPLAAAAVVFAILFSHRVAGPIKRLQIACQNMAGNTLPARVTLRKLDYFHEFAAKLNRLSEMRKNCR